MLDTLTGALITKLKNSFPNVKVYDEPIQQRLETPCFNIKTARINTQRQVGLNVNISFFYFLTFTPESSVDARAEMDRMVWTLISSKSWRYLGDFAHIRNLRARHNDKVMTIRFEVDVAGVYEPAEGELIENIEGGVQVDRTEN